MITREIQQLLKNEIHAIAAEIRALKKWQRTHVPLGEERPPPPPTRFTLARSKLRATVLCALTAHARGRLHLARYGDATLPDLPAQASFLETHVARIGADDLLLAAASAILARKLE